MPQNLKNTETSASGTPLARKLGLKEGMTAWVIGSPRPYREFFAEWPQAELHLHLPDGRQADFIHLFAASYQELEDGLERAVPRLTKAGMLWVSWPKKASGLASEIDKFDVMKAGQAIGLVDVKVASINPVWSGHKFVIPVARR